MVLKHRIRILGICIPQRRSHNLVTDIRVNDLEPARVGIVAELSDQAVAQLDKAGGAGVVAEEAPEAVHGRGVAFADALDQVVELGVGGDAVELERHLWLRAGFGLNGMLVGRQDVERERRKVNRIPTFDLNGRFQRFGELVIEVLIF